MEENNNIEIWKDIPGYEGYYQASNMGRIRSIDRKIERSDGKLAKFNGMILKTGDNSIGYLQVSLLRNGFAKKWYVHTLVLLAFCGQGMVGHQACHINSNKFDNRLLNLKWGSKTENEGHKSIESRKKKLTPTIVKNIRAEPGENGLELYTYIANKYNISKCHVAKIRLFKVWKNL